LARARVGAGDLAGAVGAVGEEPLDLARVGGQLGVALLDRAQQLDDRLGDRDLKAP
jgi:hypothetical protein